MTRNRHTTAPVEGWLETLVLRELALEWNSINWALFRERMRPPAFELIDSAELLGAWHSQHRTISISRKLAMHAPWAETLEVLKHEAAHQYVDEVLGGDTSAHGARFQEVCRARGIDARARGTATDEASAQADAGADSERLRIVARVQKLLALAESSNQHEAELAAATAQRIMLKYNLELQRTDAAGDDACGHLFLGQPTGRVQAHERALAMLLSEHFFVQVIWVDVYRPLEAKRGSVLEVCGRPENLAMAEYVHTFVLRTIERLWQEHKRSAKLRSDRDRRNFLAGAVRGLDQKLRAQRTGAAQEGLVWVGDAHVDAYYHRRHPRIVTVSSRGSGHRSGYAEGESAGKSIVLSRPVSADSTPSTPRALKSGG